MSSTELTNFQKVKEFHKVFGRTKDPEVPTIPSNDSIMLRWRLISEEYQELSEELFDSITEQNGEFFVTRDVIKEDIDLSKVAKEMADLLYVIYGTYAAIGIDADKVFTEVHRSNMSKLTKDGKVLRRDDGKVLKSDQYFPADIESVIYG